MGKLKGNPQATRVSSSSSSFCQLSPIDDRLFFNPYDPPPSTLSSFIFFFLLFKFVSVFSLRMGHVIFFCMSLLLAFRCRIFKASSVFYTLHDIMKSSQAYHCFYLLTAEVNQRGFTTKWHPEPFYFSLFLDPCHLFCPAHIFKDGGNRQRTCCFVTQFWIVYLSTFCVFSSSLKIFY